MARITTVKKAQSDIKCDKCGKELKGLSYQWIKFMRQSKKVRCLDHKFTRRDTTQNEYNHFIMDVEEATDYDDVQSILEDKLSEEEEKISNMEEVNLTGGVAFDTITERIEMISEALELEVEEVEEPEEEDLEDFDREEEEKGKFEDYLSEVVGTL